MKDNLILNKKVKEALFEVQEKLILIEKVDKNKWTVLASFMENPRTGKRYEIAVRKVK